MRFSVNQPPLKGPCFLIASTPYWEQVGVKRQLAPNKGDSNNWYRRMMPKNKVKNKNLIGLIFFSLND